MFFVGKPTTIAKRLVEVCYDAMHLAIETVKPGSYLGDIGHAIQTYVEKNRFSVVREYCGHGISLIFMKIRKYCIMVNLVQGCNCKRA